MWLDCRTVVLWWGHLLSSIQRTTQHQGSNQSLRRAISLSQCALSLHCAFFLFFPYSADLVTCLKLGDGSFQVMETILQHQLDQTESFFFFKPNNKSENKCVKWNNEHFLLLMKNILFPPSAICVQAADFLSGIVMLKWVPYFFFLFFLFINHPTDSLIKHNFKRTMPLRCDDAAGLLMIHTIQ